MTATLHFAPDDGRNYMKPLLRILALAAVSLVATLMMVAQTTTPSAQLLTRARAQEQSGHIDLAAQTWQQVLLVDADNREALAGLARAARLAGKDAEAKSYLDRLRRIDPNNPEIAKIEATATSKTQNAQLQQAAHLAQTGHPDQALRLYRSVWGNRPPDGDWSLAFYDTEASIESSRADAVEGLRALAKKYPADSRYNITLGRILTYTPKTRSEGLHLLEHFPQDAEANESIRQAHLWDAQNPNAAPEIRAYLKQHPDDQIERSLNEAQSRQTESHQANPGIARGPAETAAFAALAASHVDDAEQRFLALQTEQPDNPRVAAGLGFLRMKQNNFPAAITLLEQAQANGLHRTDVDDALKTARFWSTVQHGTEALNANRIDEAVGAFKSSLLLRPDSVDALNGLAGTYMKASEPAQAVPVYRQIIKLQAKSPDAWRGLFAAQIQAGQLTEALETSRRLPPAVKADLQRTPEYFRSLASAYTAAGLTAEAHNTLEQGLALPFPDNGHALKTETRLQYAGLLSDAKHFAQAAGLYRAILYDDPESLPAWQGLISMQHQTNHDAEAIATVERMAPSVYDTALEDSGFLAMLAAIYQQQNRFELAQSLLQRAVTTYTARSQPIPLPLQLQLASIALIQNHPEQAYAIFRGVLSSHPERTDAWKGLISAMHQTHRDRDALAELRLIPLPARRDLDHDIEYQQTVASIYAATNNPAAALQLIAQIQAHYRALHGVAPADVDIQNAWLLYNTHDDRDLYTALMALGGRDDLADAQRLVVQTIWATWSVRRAGEAVDAGNQKRSLEILSVAYQAFPDNPDVSKAMAGGYLKAGDPKRALAIFNALRLTNPSSADYQSMVSAALAAPDLRQAESWLREALEKFPNDPQVLALAARFETARGDHSRASKYWKASLAAMPPVDPANRLAHVLDRADARADAHADARADAGPTRSNQQANLSSLLDPDNEAAARRPSLPSYGDTYASALHPRPFPTPAGDLYGPDPYLQGVAPVRIDGVVTPSNPAPAASRGTASTGRIGDYLPGSDTQTPQLAASEPGFTTSPSSPDDAAAFAPPTAAGNLRQQSELTPEPLNPTAPIHFLSTGVATGPAPSTPTPETPASPVPAEAMYFAPAQTPQASAPEPQSTPAPIQILPRRRDTQPSLAVPPVPETSQLTAQAGMTDVQLEQHNLPPLRGPWIIQPVAREADPRTETEQQLAHIESGYSPWRGGTGYVTHRTGTAGFDQLEILEAPFEVSTTIAGSTRLTAIVTPSLLDSGVSDGTSTDQLGTAAVGATPAQQNAAGVGGEVQLVTSNLSLSAGTTPRGFLVPNFTGRVSLHPASSPVTLSFVREGMRDSQLSYSGLRDPGSITSTYAGDIWGGVVSNAGNFQFSRGDDTSGYYAGIGGQYITGLNVETNNRIDGVAGAYWKVLKVPGSGDLTVGANFFGMHYAHNLRFFTYGQGGYFSPSVYFLANLPFTVNGQYGPNLHYTVAGAFGLQAFQEDSSLYYPLHKNTPTVTTPTAPTTPVGPTLHPILPIIPILPTPPVPFNNPSYPAQSVVGGNYDLRAELADHVIDRWYIGGFLSLNNTRDYANQTVGFFIRYMLRPQDATENVPTGLFPIQGMRPLLVP